MDNSNLYINAVYLLELLDCLSQRATIDERKAYNEVESIILDTPWKEIKDE